MSRPRKGPGDAPLLAWGDALRAAKSSRSRLRRRAAVAAVGIMLVLASAALPPTPRLVWNASASAPIGLYAVTPGRDVDTGDMVVARLPELWRTLAARRHYLPANVPLLKRVAAGPGDEVCAIGRQVFINGRWAANRVAVDPHRRPMPWWQGCLRLRGHQFFLLMPANLASFDGRYFGLTEDSKIIGKAHPLWTR